MSNVEKRFIDVNAELRAINTESDDMIVEGFAIRFNQPSEVLRSNGIKFIETINPNSFTDEQLDDLRLLSEHDHTKILARSSAGTLETKITDEGLWFRAKIVPTTYGKDVYENLKHNNIVSCSFGFEIEDNGDTVRFDKESNIYRRTLNKIKKISEITLTSMPAYKATSVSVRSVEQADEELKELHKRKLQLELDLMKLKGDLNK